MVKSLVKVTYPTWHKVPESIKKNLWSAIQVNFDLDPNSKTFVLASMARSWRAFKGQLTKRWIYANEGNLELLKHPPPKYSKFFQQPVWEEFVKSRLSANFKKISKEQSERRAKNKFPHRLSRKGYAGLKEELKEHLGEKYIDDRSFSWTKARENKHGEFDDDETKEVAKKVEEYRKQKEDGSLVTEGTSDILTLALGTPEHSGRLRGLGSGPTPTTFFKISKRGTKRQNEMLMSQLEAERKRRKEVENILKEIEAQGNLSIQVRNSQKSEKVASNTKISSNRKYVKPNMIQQGSDVIKSQSHCSKLKQNIKLSKQKVMSCPAMNISIEKECKLAFGKKDDIIAEGIVYEKVGPNEKIHNVDLGEHNVRVSVTKAISPTASLPVPIYGEIEIVEQAIGSVVAWPKEFVLTGLEDLDSQHKELIPEQQEENTDDNGCPIIDAFSEMVETMVGNIIRIPLEKEIFGGDFECDVSKQAFMDICLMRCLDLNVMITYIRLLYDKFRRAWELVKFFNPSTISKASKNDLSNLVRERLQNAKRNQVCFIPLNIKGLHWVLIVVDLCTLAVYWLDSKMCNPSGSLKLYLNTLNTTYIGGKRLVEKASWKIP